MKKTKVFIIVLIVSVGSVTFLSRSGWMQNRTENAGSDVVVNFEASQLTFHVWTGTTSGDTSGDVLLETLNDHPKFYLGTWAGKTRWHILAGEDSFVADMNGKINTYNGLLTMRGVVIDGANARESVSAQGKVIAVNPHRFVGTIRIAQP